MGAADGATVTVTSNMIGGGAVSQVTAFAKPVTARSPRQVSGRVPCGTATAQTDQAAGWGAPAGAGSRSRRGTPAVRHGPGGPASCRLRAPDALLGPAGHRGRPQR